MSRRHPIRHATDTELESWPGARRRYEHGGKHPRVVIEFGGRQRQITFAETPSDRRCVLNHLCLVRRTLRDLGAARTPSSTASRRNRVESVCVARRLPVSP